MQLHWLLWHCRMNGWYSCTCEVPSHGQKQSLSGDRHVDNSLDFVVPIKPARWHTPTEKYCRQDIEIEYVLPQNNWLLSLHCPWPHLAMAPQMGPQQNWQESWKQLFLIKEKDKKQQRIMCLKRHFSHFFCSATKEVVSDKCNCFPTHRIKRQETRSTLLE